jgi:hypothetical protein
MRVGAKGDHFLDFREDQMEFSVLASSSSEFWMRVQLRAENRVSYTIPFLNSVSEYFVPRHSIPPFHKVRIIDRKSV